MREEKSHRNRERTCSPCGTRRLTEKARRAQPEKERKNYSVTRAASEALIKLLCPASPKRRQRITHSDRVGGKSGQGPQSVSQESRPSNKRRSALLHGSI
ncbi:hypothetical protein NDU88_003270 [Pleurodeles waltl]|uniref:Uncharacterized protein n=1 Tax=Pleurodeles waltl TaxID=8319 RepID=A0AAV7UEP9_PLEWA|nr:hypothetical protein NDU88_003270 [Pleurodeles waltl]